MSCPRLHKATFTVHPNNAVNHRGYTGCQTEIDGVLYETVNRRTPFYDLARILDAAGYGEDNIQVYTAHGTRSLRGKISTLAKLSVEWRDKSGYRLTKYRPFGGVK